MGLGEGAVIRHVLKNASPQVLAVMGLQFGYLMGGSILVETVFTWPGSGLLLNKAIINRDIPVCRNHPGAGVDLRRDKPGRGPPASNP